jgi:hypothetical protein
MNDKHEWFVQRLGMDALIQSGGIDRELESMEDKGWTILNVTPVQSYNLPNTEVVVVAKRERSEEEPES